MRAHLLPARRLVASLVAGTTALAGSALTLGTTTSADAAVVTSYGFAGTAYGTQATSQTTGLSVGRAALAQLGCTRMAGRAVTRTALDGEVPGTNPQLDVGAVQSTTRSFRRDGRTVMRSTNVLDSVVLGNTSGPHLTITDLHTTADAWADRSGAFHARARVRSGDVSAATGTPLDLLLAGAGTGIGTLFEAIRSAPGDALVLPGLGRITVGGTSHRVLASHALASGIGLRATLFGADGVEGGPDDTRVTVGRAQARILRDVPAGVMGGSAWGVDADVLDGVIGIGRLGERRLPCQGTDGQVRTADAAALDLGNAGLVQLGASTARVYGVQRADRSGRAWTEGRLAALTLGSGDSQIRLRGIVGRVTASRSRSGVLSTSTRGSEIGSLTIGGVPHRIPGPGRSLEVPGVARLTFFVTERRTNGASVTAVRVTLLDASAGVSTVNAGVARTRFARR